jgi:hypothetical protein
MGEGVSDEGGGVDGVCLVSAGRGVTSAADV